MKKIRFLISTTFAVLSVALLVQERKEVKIKVLGSLTTKIFDRQQANASERLLFERTSSQGSAAGYENKVEDGVFEEDKEMLFCLPLKKIFGGESQLNLDQISSDLVEHFNRTFYAIHLPALNSSQMDVNETLVLKLKQFETSIIEPLKSRNYYIVRDRFCLALPLFYSARSLLDDLFQSGLYFLFIKYSYTFIRLQPKRDLTLNQILNDKNPAFDCSTNYTNFECLNDCLKDQIRLSRYFFRGNESGIILLDYKNKTLRHERICFERCKKNLCFFSQLTETERTTVGSNRFTLNSVRSTPSIPTSSYLIHMVGLVLSFFGLCIYRLAFTPFQMFHESGKRLLTFKLLLVLLCLAVFWTLARQVVADFVVETKVCKIKFSAKFLSSPEDLNLVLCVPIAYAMDHYNDNEADLLSQQNKLKELNFSDLESKTDDAFNETVHEIYLETLGRRSEVSYRLLDKVLFWMEKESGLFSRCIQVAVNLNEPRYLSFLQASWLKITMKHQLYSLYLLPEGQTFHSTAYRHDKGYKYQKNIHSFPPPCRDYRIEQLKGRSKCDSFANCVD